MSGLKNCPKCGKRVEIEEYPEWDDKVGIVYGALIHHKDCVEGMETSIYSVTRKKTKEEAYDTLATAWNTQTALPRFTEGEREALKPIVTYAIDGYRKSRSLPTSYTQASEYAVRDKEFEKQIATVRAMLEEAPNDRSN